MVAPTSAGRTGVKVADWTSLTYVVVDVEGNGHQSPDLVELAAVPIVDGVIGEPTTWLVRPDQPIKYFATRIHGLTNQDVADAPTLAAIKDDVLAALDADALVAHNAHADVGVLQRKLGDWKTPEVFDTLKLARRLLPDMGGYKLGTLVDSFNLAEGMPDGLSPHRATYDALAAARLFVRLATTATTLEALRGDPPGGGNDEASALF
jgi:exodeoxyribonuclease X